MLEGVPGIVGVFGVTTTDGNHRALVTRCVCVLFELPLPDPTLTHFPPSPPPRAPFLHHRVWWPAP